MVLAVRECLVQNYFKVWSQSKTQGFVVVVDFQLTLSLLLRRKTTDTAFLVLSFYFQVWRYSPTVAMSLLSLFGSSSSIISSQ